MRVPGPTFITGLTIVQMRRWCGWLDSEIDAGFAVGVEVLVDAVPLLVREAPIDIKLVAIGLIVKI